MTAYEWTEEQGKRRLELLEKERATTINELEADELEQLQESLRRYTEDQRRELEK